MTLRPARLAGVVPPEEQPRPFECCLLDSLALYARLAGLMQHAPKLYRLQVFIPKEELSLDVIKQYRVVGGCTVHFWFSCQL